MEGRAARGYGLANRTHRPGAPAVRPEDADLRVLQVALDGYHLGLAECAWPDSRAKLALNQDSKLTVETVKLLSH
jgi:hypothetical protein